MCLDVLMQICYSADTETMGTWTTIWSLGSFGEKILSVAQCLNLPEFTAQGKLSASKTFGQNPVWHVALCSSSLLSLSVDTNELMVEILRFLAFYKLANSIKRWQALYKFTCKCFDLSAWHNQKKTVFKESNHLIFSAWLKTTDFFHFFFLNTTICQTCFASVHRASSVSYFKEVKHLKQELHWKFHWLGTLLLLSLTSLRNSNMVYSLPRLIQDPCFCCNAKKKKKVPFSPVYLSGPPCRPEVSPTRRCPNSQRLHWWGQRECNDPTDPSSPSNQHFAQCPEFYQKDFE